MALSRYEGPGRVYFGARLLAEARRVRVRVSGNNREITTMVGGLVGRSRGPVRSEVSVDEAVPLGGLEEDFYALCVANTDVRIVVDLAGQRLQFDGWIEDVESEQSDQSEASLSFNVTAAAPRIL